MSVGEMTAVRQVHSEYLIAVLERGHQHSHIRLRTRMRLHVCMLRAKHLLRAINGRLLDNVRKLASAVITLARITLSILIRKDCAHRLQHCLGNKIFRRYQLKAIRLPTNLIINGIADERINLRDTGFKKTIHISSVNEIIKHFHYSSIPANSASLSIVTPRLSALVNLEPASSPATT